MKFNDIETRNDLADFLKIPKSQLSYLLYFKDVNNSYTSFDISKKNGGIRKIKAPTDELKEIQRKLAEALYKHREKSRIITTSLMHLKKTRVL